MRVLAAVVTVLLVAACGAGGAASGGDPRATATGQAGRPPAYEGVIEVVTPLVAVTEHCVDGSTLPPNAPVSSTDPPLCTADSAPLGSLLVEAGEAVDVTVERSTRLSARAADGTVHEATFADFEVGQSVAVYTDGWVLESNVRGTHLAQVIARELVLVR